MAPAFSAPDLGQHHSFVPPALYMHWTPTDKTAGRGLLGIKALHAEAQLGPTCTAGAVAEAGSCVSCQVGLPWPVT